MPATAGRVRMPANNRVHSSAALQTHDIWRSAIGYDPYAPNRDDLKSSFHLKLSSSASADSEVENTYASFQSLLALARISGANAVGEACGACKKCGCVGHLAFQCRNFLSLKDDSEEKVKDPDAIFYGLGKIKGSGRMERQEESEEEEECETSDSEVDSEIEEIIAERYGKKRNIRGKSYRKKDEYADDGSESDDGERKRRRRSKRGNKKRGSSDSDEGERKMKGRKERGRKRDESSYEEDEDHGKQKMKNRREKRRRSHKDSDCSDSDISDDSSRRRRHKTRGSITFWL